MKSIQYGEDIAEYLAGINVEIGDPEDPGQAQHHAQSETPFDPGPSNRNNTTNSTLHFEKGMGQGPKIL